MDKKSQSTQCSDLSGWKPFFVWRIKIWFLTNKGRGEIIGKLMNYDKNVANWLMTWNVKSQYDKTLDWIKTFPKNRKYFGISEKYWKQSLLHDFPFSEK